jgi:hypothetical protein
MNETYEYKFVRLEQDKSWFTGLTLPSDSACESYQDVVHEHARQGWRLVQIFAPGLSVYGAAAYFELIFERSLSKQPA